MYTINLSEYKVLMPSQVSSKDIDENIKKLKNILAGFRFRKSQQQLAYTNIEEYNYLYQKYCRELKKQGSTSHSVTPSATLKPITPVQYLLNRDIDFTTMDIKDIIAVKKKLSCLLDDANAAIELVKEDIISEYENKVKALKDDYEIEIATLDSAINGDIIYKKVI